MKSLLSYVYRLLFAALLMLSISDMLWARSIFLNGKDISSARNEDLKNVEIRIDQHGDVFIIAPHYAVHEEETFTPFSRYAQGTPPSHATGNELPNRVGTPATTPIRSDTSGVRPFAQPTIPEAGEKSNGEAPGAGVPANLPSITRPQSANPPANLPPDGKVKANQGPETAPAISPTEGDNQAGTAPGAPTEQASVAKNSGTSDGGDAKVGSKTGL